MALSICNIGDMAKVAGVQGTVKDMSLVSTTVQTIDSQRLVTPNNKIWSDVINNITAERVRRVGMAFVIPMTSIKQKRY